MNIKIIKLLAVLCAVLAVILLLEWVGAEYALNQLLNTESEASKQAYHIEDVPIIDLGGKTEEYYADLVSRPLFIQGRRPVAETASDKDNGALGSEVFDWQLNGVFTYRGTLSALFSRDNKPANKDKFRKLKVNGDLDGWILTEIHKDRAVLNQQGSEPKTLMLRKDKPKELQTATPGQEPPAQSPPDVDPRRARMQHRPINPPIPGDAETESPTEPEMLPDSEVIEEAPEIIEEAPEIIENE